MDFFKHKMGMIMALALIAAVIAVVCFCLTGGSRRSGQGGTLVRVNGVSASEVAA